MRAILLAIEGADRPELLRLPPMADYHRSTIRFHVRLLVEADLVHAVPGLGQPDHEWLALSLSWQGYDYLELIRDSRIWRAVKRGAARAGAWSLESLGTLARDHRCQGTKPRTTSPAMISDWEIWACAETIIRQYRDGASRHAAERADALLARNDAAGQQTWLRILARINALETAPPSSHRLN